MIRTSQKPRSRTRNGQLIVYYIGLYVSNSIWFYINDRAAEPAVWNRLNIEISLLHMDYLYVIRIYLPPRNSPHKYFCAKYERITLKE